MLWKNIVYHQIIDTDGQQGEMLYHIFVVYHLFFFVIKSEGETFAEY